MGSGNRHCSDSVASWRHTTWPRRPLRCRLLERFGPLLNAEENTGSCFTDLQVFVICCFTWAVADRFGIMALSSAATREVPSAPKDRRRSTRPIWPFELEFGTLGKAAGSKILAPAASSQSPTGRRMAFKRGLDRVPSSQFGAGSAEGLNQMWRTT